MGDVLVDLRIRVSGFLFTTLCLHGLLAGAISVLNRVDVPGIVCGDMSSISSSSANARANADDGNGRLLNASGDSVIGSMEIIIWPTNASSISFIMLGLGGCGNGSDVLPVIADDMGYEIVDRTSCQDVCTENTTCRAYDFCSGSKCEYRCRLFPDIVQYGETHELPRSPSAACYVKQVLASDKPHVATFFRTSDKPVSFSFTVTDSSATPRTVIAETNLTLAGFNGRRLSAPPRRGKGGHGGGGGGGGRGHAQGFNGATSQGRYGTYRPGGRTANGLSAVGRFSNGKYVRGTYGYSTHNIAVSFPGGYRRTPYGYTGMHAVPQGARMAMAMHTGYWVGGMYMLNRHSSHAHCRCVTGAEVCCGSLTVADDGSVAEFNMTEEASRDDIMTAGFIPEAYTFPLKLTVSTIYGTDYEPDRICPPGSAASNASISSITSWRPPNHQDLFFALTELEEIKEEEGDGFEWVLGVVALLICWGALLLVSGWYNNQDEEIRSRVKVEIQDSMDHLPPPKVLFPSNFAASGSVVANGAIGKKTGGTYHPVPVNFGKDGFRSDASY